MQDFRNRGDRQTTQERGGSAPGYGKDTPDIAFYKNPEKKTLKPELFSVVAEDLAKRFARDRNVNKRSQVRKFYDEVVRLNSLAKSCPEDWDDIHPYVNMLVAKATYAEGRGLVTEDFVGFLKSSVKQVGDRKDLDVFATLFEAFMGFYRKHCRSN